MPDFICLLCRESLRNKEKTLDKRKGNGLLTWFYGASAKKKKEYQSNWSRLHFLLEGGEKRKESYFHFAENRLLNGLSIESVDDHPGHGIQGVPGEPCFGMSGRPLCSLFIMPEEFAERDKHCEILQVRSTIPA